MGWTVLCVSKISPAQLTRNMILERAGYNVIAIANPDEAVRIFAVSAVHAVVFGDSIQTDRRLELARTFRRMNDSVPIIAFSKTSGSQFPAGIVDEQLESLGDPHLLLEALKRVLPLDGVGDGEVLARTASAPQNNGAASSTSADDSKTTADRTIDPKGPKNSAF